MRLALILVTLPFSILAWLLASLTVVLQLATVRKVWTARDYTELVWRDWFADRWRFSMSIGRCIWMHPSKVHVIVDRTRRHEIVHLRQCEDLCMLALVVGSIVWAATGAWGVALSLWATGGIWQVPNFVTAFLRYGVKGIYRDSSHERHAYAETDEWPDGSSWDQQRDVRRASQTGWLR